MTRKLIIPSVCFIFQINSLQKKPVPIYQAPPPDPSLQEPVLPIILEHKKLSELNDLDPFEFPVSYHRLCFLIYFYILSHRQYSL